MEVLIGIRPIQQLKATHSKQVLDFLEIFSPVAKLTSAKILLSIAALQKNWSMLQLDIINEFLNGDLFEEVHMELPLGQNAKGENLACKLNKFVYGLQQASKQWFQKFSRAIASSGFIQSSADHSFTTRSSQNIVILLYVDGIIIANPNALLISQTTTMLQNTFKWKMLGDLKFFHGLEIANKNAPFSYQKKLILHLLACKPTHGSQP